MLKPRLIRMKHAPNYLGMDRHCFNRMVRPCVIALRIGKQGIAFDRLELDQWVDRYKKQCSKQAVVATGYALPHGSSKASASLSDCKAFQKALAQSLKQPK